LFSGQKRENVGAKNVRWNDEHRFSRHVDLYLFFRGVYPV
jgi:hypothetical protein